MNPIDYYPTIENAKVRLEPLRETDLEELLPIALQPALWKAALAPITNRADLQEYLAIADKERQVGQSIPFIIFDKRTGTKAGSTRYGHIVPEHKRLEIGWTWIGGQYQRTGLNRWTKLALLDYAFGVLEMNRVELKTDMVNLQSRNAILGIGAKQEGIFRHHMVTASGRLRDSVYFSIIREEWPATREILLQKLV